MRQSTAAHRLAFALSVLFHPILLPFAVDLLNWGAMVQPTPGIFVVKIIGYLVFPAVITRLWQRRRGINDLLLQERRHRPVPLLALLLGATLVGLICTYVLAPPLTPHLHYRLVILLTLAALAGTFFLKISLHALGWGAATGLALLLVLLPENGIPFICGYPQMSSQFVFLTLILLVVAIIGSGVVIAARHYLGAHNWSQLGIGWLLGFLIGGLFMAYWTIDGVPALHLF
ncbi:MAG: hypothetical protein AAGN35_03800 [Bacteroidota bacterium]